MSGISCHTSDWTVVCLQYQAAPSIPAPGAMVKGKPVRQYIHTYYVCT